VLFENIIKITVPETDEPAGGSGGHHPAICASATNSATVMTNDAASAIRHQRHGAALERGKRLYSPSPLSPSPTDFFAATSRKRQRCAG
jgi:hypothetical protein